MRRTVGTRGAAAALSLGVLVGLSTLVGAASAKSPGSASRQPALGPLRIVGQWMVDPHARVVINHGFNVIRKTAPYYPPVFGPRDAKFLASEGFNAARIGIIWAGAEPRPGEIDRTYIRRIVALNDTLADAGLRSLVDVHQDLYGEKYGGFGAPGWASLDQPCAANDASPACSGPLQAFQHFWDDTRAPDGRGLQAHFQGVWKAGAQELRRARNLLGYDLLNEPYPGSSSSCAVFAPCPAFERRDLARFYAMSIRRIRAIDRITPIWFEPIPLLESRATGLPGSFSTDQQLGFTFHFYDRSCGLAASPTSTEAASAQIARCSPVEAAALDRGLAYARVAEVPAFLGEFGDSENSVDNTLMVDLAGERFLSWTYWQYNTTGASLSPGLLLDDSQPGSEANARQDRLDALVVPYPQAIAGTPKRFHYDRAARVMTLTYSTRQVVEQPRCSAPTTISIPRRVYPDGYRVAVRGARVLSTATAAWLELRARTDAAEVIVEVSPAVGSKTDVPRSAHDRSRAARVTCP